MADNDFQEILSKFQQVVDDLRQEPAQLISEESVEYAETLARHAVERTQAQKEFAKAVGETVVLAKMESAIQDQQLATSRLTQKLSAEETKFQQTRLEIANMSLSAGKSLLEQISDQVTKYGEITGEAQQQSDFTKKIVDLQLQKAKLLATESDTYFGMRSAKVKELDEQIRMNEQLEKGRQSLEQQKLIHERMGTLFGVNVSSVKSQFQEIQQLASTPLGILTLIGTAIGALFKTALDGFVTIRREAGTTLQQTATLSKTAIAGIGVSLKDHIALTTKDAAELTGELASHFGDIGLLTGQSVANVARLHTVIGLSVGEAATYEATLEHGVHLTAEQSKHIIQTADEIARINNLAPQKVFAEMAKNADLMARAGERGQESLAKAAAFAAKAGVELQKFDSFADKALDVTDMVQNFTKLGTLGIDLGDPFQFAKLAESNDLKGIQDLLRSVDLKQAEGSRTRQKALEESTGFSFAELKQIQETGEVKGPEGISAKERAGVVGDEKTDALVTSFGHLIASTNLATIALNALGIAAAISGAGKLLGGGGLASKLGGLLKFGGGAGAAGGGGAAAGGAGALATGGTILGGLAGGLAIGTGITEALGMDSLLDFKRIHDSNVRGDQATAEYQRIRVRTEAMHRALAEGKTPEEARGAVESAANTGVESRLSELITLFKRGGLVVMMDGKRVGKLVAAAQPRESVTTNIG